MEPIYPSSPYLYAHLLSKNGETTLDLETISKLLQSQNKFLTYNYIHPNHMKRRYHNHHHHSHKYHKHAKFDKQNSVHPVPVLKEEDESIAQSMSHLSIQEHIPEKKQEEEQEIYEKKEELLTASTESTKSTLSPFELIDYFTILKLVSSLKEGDKLRLSNDKKKISIDQRYLTSIFRWWTQDNRKDSITYLEEFYDHLFHYISDHLDDWKDIELDESFTTEYQKNNISTLLHQLELSVQGLYHLKSTYQNDVTIQSNIELLIQKIQFHLMKRKEQFVVQK